MPSSSRPYQSKLLRFALKQWQQGLERQDRAWRQLQSTAVWGSQVAVFPIYAIMRAVKRASFVLGSGSGQPERPIATIAKEKVTDLDHSLTAILTHTQQLLSSDQTAQLAIAPKSSLVRRAKSLLSNAIQRVRQQLPGRLKSTVSSTAIARSQRRSGGLATGHQGQRQTGGLTTATSASMHRRVSSELVQNGTTLASSIESRKLVLVNPSNEIFDIFTPEQQTDLQHYITRVMHAYRQSRTLVPRQTKQLSVKTVLAIGAVFIAALPMEFKKAWAQITPVPQAPSLPHITSPQAEPNSHIFYPPSSTPATVKTRVRHLAHDMSQNIDKGHARRLTSDSPDAFEASVNNVSYLEHPLERVLRWVDRLLTWCEHRWQQWLEHRANVG